MSTATSTAPEIVVSPVAIDVLYESTTNPRKVYDAVAMKELQASIEEKGVLVPLMVRAKAKGPKAEPCFEIVAGTRRYRAAKAAGLKYVPCQIRVLTDEQAVEIQIIDNLQREGVHPLDEAAGYRALMERNKMSIAQVAERVSKPERYVRDRLNLTALIPELAKRFANGGMNLHHAILLARLQPADQTRSLKEFFERRGEAPSVADLKEWLNDQVLLELSGAPWKKDDATLVPKAGACLDCPKRTGFNKTLFPEVGKRDVCTDPTCFEEKMQEHIANLFDDLTKPPDKEHGESRVPLLVSTNWAERLPHGTLGRDQYRAAKNAKECASTMPAIVIQGENRGHVIHACTDPKCKVHQDRSFRQSPSQLAANRAIRLKQRIEHLSRWRVLEAIIAKMKTPTTEDWRFNARQAWSDLGHDAVHDFVLDIGWVKTSKGIGKIDIREVGEKQIATLAPAALPGMVQRIQLYHYVRASWNGWTGWKDRDDELAQSAKRHSVDAKKIESQVKAELSKPKKPATRGGPRLPTTARSRPQGMIKSKAS
jgi:ParB family transcriptional regulator, chromosome partitioning protein